jgi:hypothetical protein
MWMIELTTNTITAERRIGNHNEINETITASFVLIRGA